MGPNKFTEPLGNAPIFGNRFFYILYFQTPGVAEQELRHDVRATMRRFLFGASGNAPDHGPLLIGTDPKTAFFLDQFVNAD